MFRRTLRTERFWIGEFGLLKFVSCCRTIVWADRLQGILHR